MKISTYNVNKLTEEAKEELLVIIISKLDELDDDDYFGTEGWRHTFGLED